MNIIFIILVLLAIGLLVWILLAGRGTSHVEGGGTTTWQMSMGDLTIIVPKLLLVVTAMAVVDYCLYTYLQACGIQPTWLFAFIALIGLVILSWRWVSAWVQNRDIPTINKSYLLLGLLIVFLVPLLYYVALNIGSWIMALLSLLLWPIVPSMGSMGLGSIILWSLVGAWVITRQVDDRDRRLWIWVFGVIIGFKILWLLGTLVLGTSWNMSLPSVSGVAIILSLLVGLLVFLYLRNTEGLGKVIIALTLVLGIIFGVSMMSGMSFPLWSSSTPGTVAPVTPPSYTPPVYPGNTSGLPQGVISGGNEATY